MAPIGRPVAPLCAVAGAIDGEGEAVVAVEGHREPAVGGGFLRCAAVAAPACHGSALLGEGEEAAEPDLASPPPDPASTRADATGQRGRRGSWLRSEGHGEVGEREGRGRGGEGVALERSRSEERESRSGTVAPESGVSKGESGVSRVSSLFYILVLVVGWCGLTG